MAFKPMMSEKEAKKRKDWQEKIYNSLKKIKKKQKIRVLGKELVVLPGLFAPLWQDSILLAKAVRKETRKKDIVLDIGAGTGIQAIFAAEKAEKVLAVDINQKAVECAKINAKRLGLENKIRVLKSDLFSKAKGKFDLIIFNPPFRWFKPRNELEKSSVDEGYKTLKEFFKKAEKHLSEKGRILLVFASSGDIKFAEHLIKESCFKCKIMAKQKSNGWEYTIFRLAKKLSKAKDY